jgi:hypothetical protein
VTEPLVVEGPEGSITVTPAALSRLVVQAAEGVRGARVRRPRRAVEVVHGEGDTVVSLELAVAPATSIAGAAREVQARVAEAVTSTCGLEVSRVDVSVEEVG